MRSDQESPRQRVLRLGHAVSLPAVRAFSLFLGGFCTINLVALWTGRMFDANSWWLDARFIPTWTRTLGLILVAAALLGFAIFPVVGRVRRWLTVTTYLQQA